MNNVKLEPGWLEKDVGRAARRTVELDEQKNTTRKASSGSADAGTSCSSDSAKGDHRT